MEFYVGTVTKAELQETEDGDLRGYGFIRVDGAADLDLVWFGSKTTNGIKLAKGDRVKFALASALSRSGRHAASVVRPLDETKSPHQPNGDDQWQMKS